MFWSQNNESNATGEAENRAIIEYGGVAYSVPKRSGYDAFGGVAYSVPKRSGYDARHQFQQPDGAAVPSDSACS